LIVANDAFDCAKFLTTESEITRQSDRFKPELRRIVVAIHMHMQWFIWLVAVEVAMVANGKPMYNLPDARGSHHNEGDRAATLRIFCVGG